MKPTYCAFHPKQLIVNFCKNQSCLLPMCPNCVKVHSKQHTTQNTFGQYEHIHDVYQEVQTNLQNVLKALVNSNEDLKEVFCEKQNRRQNIKKKMHQYKAKVLSSIERCIDQLETQILSSIGGHESNIEEDFSQINQKIQAISKHVQKQARTLAGQKTLKGIINHFSSDMPNFYDDKLDEIETQIMELQSKDVSMCKEFKITQLQAITQKIRELYKGIFVGTLNQVKLKKRQSRISKLSNSHVSSTNGFGRTDS